MPIRYRCPHCHQLMSIATRMAGREVECPKCAVVHVVPAESTDALPPARPASQRVPADAPAVPHADVERSAPAPRAMTMGAETEWPASEGPAVAAPPPLPNDRLAERTQHWLDDQEDEGLVIQGFERKSDELDLIPMVDCVFLLLVFYMITASYALQKTIDVAPPSPEKKGTVQAVQSMDELAQSSIIVQIDGRNRIFVDDVPLGDASGLADTLRTKMNGEQKNELVIEADPQAFHETVVAVVDAAHDLQFQKVRMSSPVADAD